MSPVVPHSANGLYEPMSQHNLDICTPFDVALPETAPFKPEDIVIGRLDLLNYHTIDH